MANKRKQEEEEAYRLLLKAQRRRKKFKEALLEKALRSREDGDIPGGGTTKAYLSQKISKQQQAEPITDEEALQLDLKKREKVAAVRKRFKAQYKKVLETLMEKNLAKEEEEEAKAQRSLLPLKRSVSQTKKLIASQGVEISGGHAPFPAAGSALSAIRHRDDTNDENRENEALQDVVDPQELEEQRARRLATKMQQMKIAAYLSTLSEQKKIEDNKKIVHEVFTSQNNYIHPLNNS